MTTFKNFLLEKTQVLKKWESKNLNTRDAIHLLNTSFKDGLRAIANGQILFRGDRELRQDKITTLKTGGSERTSRDTNNIYNLAMNLSASLAEFPKRTSSITTSNHPFIASMYSSPSPPSLFVIFPKDGTILASSDEADFLLQEILTSEFFPYPNVSIDQFNSVFEHFLVSLGYRPTVKYTDSQKINDFLSKIDSATIIEELDLAFGQQKFSDEKHYVSKPKLNNMGLKLQKKIEQNKSKIFTWLSTQIMTPESLNIKLSKFSKDKLLSIENEGREIWFSGEAAAIPHDIFKNIINEMIELDMPVHEKIKNFFK